MAHACGRSRAERKPKRAQGRRPPGLGLGRAVLRPAAEKEEEEEKEEEGEEEEEEEKEERRV